MPDDPILLPTVFLVGCRVIVCPSSAENGIMMLVKNFFKHRDSFLSALSDV